MSDKKYSLERIKTCLDEFFLEVLLETSSFVR